MHRSAYHSDCEGHALKNWIVLLFAAALMLCPVVSQAQAAPEAEPQTLLDGAVDALQSASSFRLGIEQTGAPYQLALTLDGVNMLPRHLKRRRSAGHQPGRAIHQRPCPPDPAARVDIYSRDDRQWLSFPSGAPWLQLPAFEGFDISRLLAPDDGIDKVMTNLSDAQSPLTGRWLMSGPPGKFKRRPPATRSRGCSSGSSIHKRMSRSTPT